MALPIIAVPKYTLNIPSSGREITYRPFLVKEEKILLIAMESEDEKQMSLAIQEIIKNCVLEEVNVKTMPMFDIEYIFLQLRAKSKGEVVEMSFECGKCKKPIEAKIDLTKIEITRTEGHTNKITLSDEVGVTMSYPSMDIQNVVTTSGTDVDNIFNTIAFCIESIWDKESVYAAKDHTKEEMEAFIDSLPDTSFSKIQQFFDTVPVLRHEIPIQCKSKNGKSKNASICGWKDNKILEGLASFFA